jgi:hypothetical protein
MLTQTQTNTPDYTVSHPYQLAPTNNLLTLLSRQDARLIELESELDRLDSWGFPSDSPKRGGLWGIIDHTLTRIDNLTAELTLRSNTNAYAI